MPRGQLKSRRALADAAAGLALAVILILLVGYASSRFWIPDARLGLLLGYLAVWLPLLGAALVATYRHGARSLPDSVGLRFRSIDLLWGLAVGLLARVAAGIVEIAVYGRLGSSAPTLGEPVYDAWWVFAALLAPVLLAPFIEELFFRGLLLRAVRRAAPARVATVVAIVVSGALFALVHLLQATSFASFAAIGLSTLVFGLAAATVAAVTGRIGGAVVAHVTFNALVVVPGIL